MVSHFGVRNFPPEARPYRPGHVHAYTDLASFEELWFGGAQVFTDCWKSKGIPGWVEVGVKEDIGMFMWTANSDVDRRFQLQFQRLAANLSIDTI